MSVETSKGARIGMFVIACFAIMMVPVVVGSLMRQWEVGHVSHTLVGFMAVTSAIGGVACIGGAIYSLYFSMFGRDPA